MSDDLSAAVLNAMWPLPRVIPCAIDERDLPKLREAKAKCAKWREWAEAESSLDARTRAAYLKWIAFCESDNARAELMIATDEWRIRMDAYDKKRREKQERVARISIMRPPVKF